MNEPFSPMSSPGPRPVEANSAIGHGASPAIRNGTALGRAVDFQALLDRLEQRVHGLEAVENQIDGPRELSAAVDQAEASLEEALSLGSKLLEAFRAEGHRAGSTEGDGGQ